MTFQELLEKSNVGLSPLGRLLVVFDFFSHGTGDFFSVDSYIICWWTNEL